MSEDESYFWLHWYSEGTLVLIGMMMMIVVIGCCIDLFNTVLKRSMVVVY